MPVLALQRWLVGEFLIHSLLSRSPLYMLFL